MSKDIINLVNIRDIENMSLEEICIFINDLIINLNEKNLQCEQLDEILKIKGTL